MPAIGPFSPSLIAGSFPCAAIASSARCTRRRIIARSTVPSSGSPKWSSLSTMRCSTRRWSSGVHGLLPAVITAPPVIRSLMFASRFVA